MDTTKAVHRQANTALRASVTAKARLTFGFHVNTVVTSRFAALPSEFDLPRPPPSGHRPRAPMPAKRPAGAAVPLRYPADAIAAVTHPSRAQRPHALPVPPPLATALAEQEQQRVGGSICRTQQREGLTRPRGAAGGAEHVVIRTLWSATSDDTADIDCTRSAARAHQRFRERVRIKSTSSLRQARW